MSNSAALKRYFSDPSNRKKVSDTQKKLHVEHPERFDSFGTATEMRRQGLITPSCMKGKKQTEEAKRRIGVALKRLWQDPEYRQKVTNNATKSIREPICREKASRRMKLQWQNKEYAKKVLHRRGKSMPELAFEKLCHLKGYRYRFVGNGDLMIGRKNPDFVNLKDNHKLVEIWGEFFKKGRNPNDLIEFYAEYGYRCLVIWASELKHIDLVIAKLQKFEEA